MSGAPPSHVEEGEEDVHRTGDNTCVVAVGDGAPPPESCVMGSDNGGAAVAGGVGETPAGDAPLAGAGRGRGSRAERRGKRKRLDGEAAGGGTAAGRDGGGGAQGEQQQQQGGGGGGGGGSGGGGGATQGKGNKKKQKPSFRYGNYHRYYGYRVRPFALPGLAPERRSAILQRDLNPPPSLFSFCIPRVHKCVVFCRL